MLTRIAAIVTLSACPLLADSWPSPQIREVFSPSRSHFVRATPGNNWGETVGFANSPKGPPAEAEFYERQPDASYRRIAIVPLLNPVAPVDFFVTDQGFLVTLDNWHNRGYGKVLAIYRPNGQVLRSFELADLFSAQEISRFSTSVSSIHWRGQLAYINPDHRSLYVGIREGSDITVDVASATYQYCDSSTGKYACRSSNTNRVWRPFQAPDEPKQ